MVSLFHCGTRLQTGSLLLQNRLVTSSIKNSISFLIGRVGFGFVLFGGLKGLADGGKKDGFIKTTELASYMDDKLPEVSQREFQYEQFPVSNTDGQAFPVSWVQ